MFFTRFEMGAEAQGGYGWSLAAAGVQLVGAAVVVVVWWRWRMWTKTTRGSPWPWRNRMLGCFLLATLGRLVMLVLQTPDAVCGAASARRSLLRVLSSAAQASGFFGHWAGFTLLVLFIEEVRRAKLHSDPVERQQGIVCLRRAVGFAVLFAELHV